LSKNLMNKVEINAMRGDNTYGVLFKMRHQK
jgi:hypothetical protein